MFKQRMWEALRALPAMVNMYFPDKLRDVLLAQSSEMDRLRAEVDELRSKIKE